MEKVNSIDIIVANEDDKSYALLDAEKSFMGFSPDMKITKNSDKIKIDVEKKLFGFSGIGGNSGVLYIVIPDSYLGEITMNTVSGNIETTNKLENEFEKIELSVVSGDINFVLNEAEKIVMDSVSGEAVLEAESVGSLTFDTVSGSLDLISRIEESVYADSVSGDFKINLRDINSAEVSFDSLSGNLDNNLDGNDGLKIRADSVSGNLAIN